MEGTTVLATYREPYQAVLSSMGQAFATGGHGYFDGVSYDYYAAGSHWVIVRFPHAIFVRSAPTPDFALADGNDAIPDGWGRDVLEKARAAAR